MTDAALTRKAIEEIVRELNDGKDQNQAAERKTNPLGKPNKRFLGRTINSMITHNKREDRRTRENCRQKLRQLDDRQKKRLRQEFRRRHSKSRKQHKSPSESSHEVYSSSSEESRCGKLRKPIKKKKKLTKFKRVNESSSGSSDSSSGRSGSGRNSEYANARGHEEHEEMLHEPVSALNYGPINQWLMYNQAFLAGAASAQAAKNTVERSGDAVRSIRLSSNEVETDSVMEDLRVSDSSEESAPERQHQILACISLDSSDGESNQNHVRVNQETKSKRSVGMTVADCIMLDSDTESDDSEECNQSRNAPGQNKTIVAPVKKDKVETCVDLDTESESEKTADPQVSECIALDSDSDSGNCWPRNDKTDVNPIMVISDTESNQSKVSEIIDKHEISKCNELNKNCPVNVQLQSLKNSQHVTACGTNAPVGHSSNLNGDSKRTGADKAMKDQVNVEQKEDSLEPTDVQMLDCELECSATNNSRSDVDENKNMEERLPEANEEQLKKCVNMDADACNQEFKEPAISSSGIKDKVKEDDEIVYFKEIPAVVDKINVDNESMKLLEKRKSDGDYEHPDADNDYMGIQEITRDAKEEELYLVSEVLGIGICKSSTNNEANEVLYAEKALSGELNEEKDDISLKEPVETVHKRDGCGTNESREQIDDSTQVLAIQKLENGTVEKKDETSEEA